ncbi:TPA: hypothetical protein ACV09U_001632 [Campylobacter coli]
MIFSLSSKEKACIRPCKNPGQKAILSKHRVFSLKPRFLWIKLESAGARKSGEKL